jgi:aspartate-semialdehyde dehydrogenase
LSLRIAVVGATGMVGQTMLQVLAERRLPVEEIIAVASDRSAGKTVAFGGEQLPVRPFASVDFSNVQIALFAAGSAASRELIPVVTTAGCLVVDNASEFRMDPDVPLVVPEVNPEALAVRPPRGIVANPNCSTIQLSLVLKPIADLAGLEQVRVATYQAVSGAGRGAVAALKSGLEAGLAGAAPDPAELAFNVIPQIGELDADGYSEEERKISRETQRILGLEGLLVSATAVRVPVLNGHSEAIWLRTRDPLSPEAAAAGLAQAPGVHLMGSNEAPTPASLGFSEDRALVGRVRRDGVDARGLLLWVVADNLRKGAATNAVQIAEILVKSYC